MTQSILENSWVTDYRRRLTTAEKAAKLIKSGDKVYVHSNAAVPVPLIDAMVERASELRNVEIFHLLTLGEASYARPEHASSFRVHALFIGANVRDAVNDGSADYTPVFLSEIPALFTTGAVQLDVCLLQVSPPDEHGFCSYGVSTDCSIAARKSARLVIAEVNQQMPRTLGRSFVHVSRLDHIIETDRPLPELLPSEPDETELLIGRNVASLIEDCATLQMGIGAIPNAVLRSLRDRQHLGVHTEMFSDGLLDLIECGAVTNDAKTVLPGKIATSFVMGSRKLYDFINNNPMFEFQTSDFINDPFVISQNQRMTAINSAIEIDLSGQVCADTIGSRLYSGFGGQVDFIRGAARARGGRPIIAVPSTACAGEVSRIKPFLSLGSGVVTSRADVHYVVTEFGIAQLHGKNLKERCKALIAIAHPKFRSMLEEESRKVKWMA